MMACTVQYIACNGIRVISKEFREFLEPATSSLVRMLSTSRLCDLITDQRALCIASCVAVMSAVITADQRHGGTVTVPSCGSNIECGVPSTVACTKPCRC